MTNSLKDRDLELWEEWVKRGKSQTALKPLYQAFKPTINKEVNRFRHAPMPKASIKSHFVKHFMGALDKYDPNRGASLHTFVTGQLRQGGRFVKNYQNMARIPLGRIEKIRDFNAAKSYLRDTFNREPNADELSDHLKWPLKDVELMEQIDRKDLSFGVGEMQETQIIPSRQKKVFDLLGYDLNSEEKVVWEYYFGKNGKPEITNVNTIASKSGFSTHKVYRLLNSIKAKAKEFL